MKKVMFTLLSFTFFISLLNAQIRYDHASVYPLNLETLMGNNRSFVKPDVYGNYIISTIAQSPRNEIDFKILKYTSSGALLWETSYNGAGDKYDESKAMAVDKYGNVYVTGKSISRSGTFDCATLKINKDGKTEWTHIYENDLYGNSEGNSITVDDEGNVYVAGASGKNYSETELLLLKLNNNGEKVWIRKYNGNTDRTGFLNCISVFKKNIYLTGSLLSARNENNFIVLKYDNEGNLVWHNSLGGNATGFDAANSLFVDENENVFVTGNTVNLKTGPDITTAKYDRSGRLLWRTDFNGSANGNDWSNHILVDKKGSAYICGGSQNINLHHPDNNNDATTIKYKPTGEIEWVNIYDGSAHYHDCLQGLAFDENENVLVTGRSHCGINSTNDDLIAIKYSSGGETLWSTKYNSEGNSMEYGNDIISDMKGGIYITGTINKAGVFDLLVLKYLQNNVNYNLSENKISLSNYPNPFNPVTKIQYELPAVKFDFYNVTIKIYNSLGKVVETLLDQKQNPGSHSINWNAVGYTSGVYFYKLEAGDFVETKRMILLK